MKRAVALWRRAGEVVALSALAVACNGSGSSTDSRGTSASSTLEPGTPATPVDHLAPGELVEGTEEAFGLTLPQGIRVDEAFTQVVYASGAVTVHPLVQYLRSKLRDGDLREGETSATFEHVTVPGQSERPLTIHIVEVRREAVLEIRDATPRPAPNLPDEAARWKSVGLTPNGRLADPTHLD